jgi:hypothetical protein
MRKEDRDCHIICRYQAKLFEQSVTRLDMSSPVFVRRFMYSEIVEDFDCLAFLDGSLSLEGVFEYLEDEYGPSDYGSVKYHKDVMYWIGYLYRYFSYCYEITSKRAYKLLPLKYVAESYEAYHTLDIKNAIERLLESKNISFDPVILNKKALDIMRKIKNSNL